MRKLIPLFQRLEEIPTSAIVLALILLFTYVRFFEVPYSGFYFHPSTGEVLQIFVESKPAAALHEGDFIKKIGGVSWESYDTNATQGFFENAKAGEVVEISVLRDSAVTIIPWVFPGFNSGEFKVRFLNLWWLAYIFWTFGILTQLFIRPKDARWRLLSAANYLTGFWVIFGTVSASQTWGSSLLLHAVTWLMAPVYLHLHWVFPRPLKGMPTWGWVILYLAGIALALSELMQAIPRTFYALGFFLALVGSIALLIVHIVRQPTHRREIALLGIAILVVFVPVISLGIAGITHRIQQFGPLSLLALPIIPGAYFYIVYLQQPGGLELRANRIISVYMFLTLLGAILLLLLAPASLLLVTPGAMIFLSIAAASLTALLSIVFFPAFQAFVERRLLGIKLPYQNLPETYSSRITTSTSMPALLKLLDEEVFPSLLVRQFAFLQLSGDECNPLLVKGVEADQLPKRDETNSLVALAGQYFPPADNPTHSWIRLILPLNLGGNITGLWLFGRRDPDDAYHEAELPILQSLADQTAIAMSNLLQTERLRQLFQLDIDRREQERLRLALELHDSVLNQLAVMRMNVDEPNLSPNSQKAYEGLVQRLREIVSNLRPPMLNYGLKLALEDLTQTLTERSGDHAKVTLEMQASGERYPQNIELHLFRIVQEACENALRHAKAARVTISAKLDVRKIHLSIEDNGVGFEMGESLELDDLLVHKHFGLVGIVERANLVGAQASIWSEPRTGTRVQVVWNGTPPPGPE